MTNKLSLKNNYMNYVLFAVLALLWSGSFINIRVVVTELPPVFSAMMRVLISMICLAVIFKSTGKKIFELPERYWKLWVAGLFSQALPFAFLFYGEKFIAPALAGIINSTVSIWALLLGTLIFRDWSQWTLMKVLGLLLGFGGIVLIFFPMLGNGSSTMTGVVSVFGMAICYAIGGIINQYVIFKHMKVSFETNLFQQHVASVVFLSLLSLVIEPWPSISALTGTGVMLAFLYLGLMSTAFAWIIYFYLLKQWGAVRASSVMYIVPLLAIVWDLLFLHFVPNNTELIGAAAILGGVTLIQYVRKPKVELVAEPS